MCSMNISLNKMYSMNISWTQCTLWTSPEHNVLYENLLVTNVLYEHLLEHNVLYKPVHCGPFHLPDQMVIGSTQRAVTLSRLSWYTIIVIVIVIVTVLKSLYCKWKASPQKMIRKSSSSVSKCVSDDKKLAEEGLWTVFVREWHIFTLCTQQ